MPNTQTEPLDAALAELDAAERGFVLGTLLARDGASTDDAARSLAEPSASRCRGVLSAMIALARPERLRRIGLMAREALAPVPAGIEAVQEDILQEALRHQSAFVIRLIAAQGPSLLREVAATVLRQRGVPVSQDRGDDDAPALTDVAPDVVAEIQRAVLAGVVPVPAATAGAYSLRPAGLGRRLATLPIPALMAELAEAGARVLGASLHGADDATLKRAVALAGTAWSDVITRAARAPTVGDHPSVTDETTAREWARRLMKAPVGGSNAAGDILARLGARELGERLAREDPDAHAAIAQRLPPDLRRELCVRS